jgi:hypothetical protein
VTSCTAAANAAIWVQSLAWAGVTYRVHNSPRVSTAV